MGTQIRRPLIEGHDPDCCYCPACKAWVATHGPATQALRAAGELPAGERPAHGRVIVDVRQGYAFHHAELGHGGSRHIYEEIVAFVTQLSGEPSPARAEVLAEVIAGVARVAESMEASRAAALGEAEKAGSVAGVILSQGHAACCREWAGELRQLLASVQAPAPPQRETWQPIATAPQVHPLNGGDDLLLYWEAPAIGEPIMEVGQWRDGWWSGANKAFPTHWMPLPAPPEAL